MTKYTIFDLAYELSKFDDLDSNQLTRVFLETLAKKELENEDEATKQEIEDRGSEADMQADYFGGPEQ